MTFELPLRIPTLPPGFCATLGQNWPQQLLNEVAKGVALLTSDTGKPVVSSDTAPDISLRNLVLWHRPADGRIYGWQDGHWAMKHAYTASGGVRIMWAGTPADLWAEDGGDGTDPSLNAPAPYNGAMWEVDPEFAGRSPMGVGDIPNVTTPKTLALNENYGSGEATLQTTNLPPHTHGAEPAADSFATLKDGTGGTGNTGLHTVNGGASGTNGVLSSATATGSAGGSGSPAATQPFSIIHNVRGIYLIRRTARVFYTA